MNREGIDRFSMKIFQRLIEIKGRKTTKVETEVFTNDRSYYPSAYHSQ